MINGTLLQLQPIINISRKFVVNQTLLDQIVHLILIHLLVVDVEGEALVELGVRFVEHYILLCLFVEHFFEKMEIGVLLVQTLEILLLVLFEVLLLSFEVADLLVRLVELLLYVKFFSKKMKKMH